MAKIIAILISIGLSILTTSAFDFSSVVFYILVGIGFFVAYLIAIVALFFLSAVIITIPVNTKKAPDKYSRFYQKAFAVYIAIVLSTFGVKLEAKGKEMVPTDTNLLLVSNHLSNIDPLVANWYLRKFPLIFASKKSLFKIPFFGKFIHKIGYLKLERNDMGKDLKELERGFSWLKQGQCSLAIYPEGTRNKTDELMLPFKDACFKFAMRAKKPIVVSVINGTKQVNDKLLVKRHVVEYEIIEVIKPEDYEGKTVQEVSAYVREIMSKRIIELRNK